MSTWRRKAIEVIPHYKPEIERAKSPAELWIELFFEFEKAVEDNSGEILKGILTYLRWSYSDEAGFDSQQAVNCGFLEDIVGNSKNWSFFSSWFSKAEFENYRGSFQYALSDKQFRKLENEFYVR